MSAADLPVVVYACERCLTAAAVVYDTYADVVLCGSCAGDPDSTYGCQFILPYIPQWLAETIPARPTIPDVTREPHMNGEPR